MFDIGFPELLIVSIVALLVIGPERLPETIRTLAVWIGRLRRSLSNIKTELENEIGADEIRRQIYNEDVMKELGDELTEAKREFEDMVSDTSNTMSEVKDFTQKHTSLKPAAIAAQEQTEKNTDTSDQNDGHSGREAEGSRSGS